MIVLAVYSKSQWSMLSRLAGKLQERGETVGAAYFGAQEGGPATAIATDCAANDYRFFSHEEYSAAVDQVPATAASREFLHEVAAVIPASHPYRILLRRQIEGACQLLAASHASLLVVCEDGPGGDSPLIAAAKAMGLKVIVVPYGIGESKDYDVFLADKATEGNLNRVPDNALGAFIRNRAPHWIRPTEYGDALLFPAEFVAARLAEGLDLPMPWAVQGGNADYIAVESAAMRRHFVREGIPEAKLVDVGTLYCDTIYAAMHEHHAYMHAFETQEKILRGRTSILVALPPSYHSTRSSQSEFSSFEDLCRAVFGYCSTFPDVDLTVSVHPNCSNESVAAIRAAGARISDAWLVGLIAQHDIFLTDFSSTIRWAIAARKPVINYDIYRFDLHTYDDVDGVLTRQRFFAVKEEIDRLVNDDHAYREVAVRQRTIAKDWGILDGRNFERLYALLKQNLPNRSPGGVAAHENRRSWVHRLKAWAQR